MCSYFELLTFQVFHCELVAKTAAITIKMDPFFTPILFCVVEIGAKRSEKTAITLVKNGTTATNLTK